MPNNTIRKAFPLLLAAILVIGLIAGTLDLLGAYIGHNVFVGNLSLVNILKYISSAAFGPAASSGGWEMVILGIIFHYCIAISFTAIYFLLYRHLPFLQNHVIVSGLLYGILVWMIMNLFVLQLTRLQLPPLQLNSVVRGAITLMICIGIPIALLTHKYYQASAGVHRRVA